MTFAAVSSCGEKKTSQKKGIAPMMEILAECPEFLQGVAVADQVIGKAAAFLFAKAAQNTFMQRLLVNMHWKHYRTAALPFPMEQKCLISSIGTKMACAPVEQTVLSVTDVEEAYGKLQEKLRELSERN